MCSVFHDCNNILVTGGNFSVVPNAHKGFAILREHIASGAFHDSGERFDPPKCHPDTRVAVLQEIMDWVESFDLSSSILWLYGDAGAGKSSIAQTIAEKFHSLRLLIASFFFSRTASGRSDAKRLIASLSYQLALSVPEARNSIETAVEHDPAIFDKALQVQVRELIVEPMIRALTNLEGQSGNQAILPRLIIIDGLDECDQPQMQQHILNVLASALQEHNLPICILIASRPEEHIRNSFDNTSLTSIATRIGLNDQYDAEADIRLYLHDMLGNIKRSHPLRDFIPSSWPTEHDIETIVTKSSGQFIYATTVARYTELSQHKPHERLNIVLGPQPVAPDSSESPFRELDALYSRIFCGVDALSVVLEIIFMVLQMHSIGKNRGIQCDFEHPRVIEEILSLRPGDVRAFLMPLASIIRYQGDDKPLRIQHASLGDFLLDSKRSGRFSIDPGKMYAEFSRTFLHNILRPDGFVEDGALQYFFDLCEDASPDADLIQDFCCLDLWEICDAIYNGRQHLDRKIFRAWDYSSFSRHSLGLFLSDFLFLIERSPAFLEQRNEIYQHHCGNLDRVFEQHFHKYSSNKHLIDLPAFVVCAERFKSTPQQHTFYSLMKILEVSSEDISIDEQAFRILSFSPSRAGVPEGKEEFYMAELRSFFLDERRSNEHFVGGKEYARAALRCLEHILSKNLDSLEYRGGVALFPYLLAFRYLAVMLERSTYDNALVHELSKFTKLIRMNEIPFQFRVEVQEAELAITTYLKGLVCLFRDRRSRRPLAS